MVNILAGCHNDAKLPAHVGKQTVSQLRVVPQQPPGWPGVRSVQRGFHPGPVQQQHRDRPIRPGAHAADYVDCVPGRGGRSPQTAGDACRESHGSLLERYYNETKDQSIVSRVKAVT